MAQSGESRSARLKAEGVLALITAVWGVTFVVVKDALAEADAFTFLTLRFTTGALVMTLLAGRRMLAPRNLRHGVVLSVLLFAGFVLQTLGLEETSPSRSAFITGLSVLLVPLTSFAVFRRAPRVASLVGVILATVGLALLTRSTDGELDRLTRGDLLTLGCAAAYALHITYTERYAVQGEAVPLVAVQLWGVAILSALVAPAAGPHVTFSPAFIAAFLFCGVVASALAIGVQTWAQARTSAVRAALIYSFEPVFAAGYSVWLGYERLGLREWLGGGLIVLAVIVAELGLLLGEWWRRGGLRKRQ